MAMEVNEFNMKFFRVMYLVWFFYLGFLQILPLYVVGYVRSYVTARVARTAALEAGEMQSQSATLCSNI